MDPFADQPQQEQLFPVQLKHIKEDRLAGHAGIIGFLMYDEPCATDFDSLAELKTKFDSVMPADKLFYVNLYPECAGDSPLKRE